MFRLTLEQGHSIGSLLLVAAIAIGLTAVFYYRTYGRLNRLRWLAMLALRSTAIVIVVLLLFRPVANYYTDLKDKKAVVFAVDTSASMGIADDASGRTRLALATERVDRWCTKLDADFAVHVVEFAEGSRVLEGAGQLPTLVAEGKSTSLTRGMAAAVNVSQDGQKVARDQIEAVFLLSDGVHNTNRRPEDDAQKLGVPVYAIGVGASLKNDISYRDVRLAGLSCADTLMLQNQARIRASVEGVNMPGRVIQVLLEEDGELLEQIELALDEGEGVQEVEFEFRPQEEGRHVYTVRIPPLEEEKIDENNSRSHVALVVEPGIRVLYIEGTLRQEYGAISQRFLSKDPDLQFCSLVQTRPNVFLRRTNMDEATFNAIPTDQETFDRFDVFILGDLDASYIKPQQQAMIVDRVRRGGGLIMLGGYHSLGPGGYHGTPVGDALPVLVGDRDIGQIPDEFLPKLTPDGTHSPIFANIAAFFPTTAGEAKVGGLPPLAGCTRLVGAKPGATVLATCPLERTIRDQEMPVLAIQPLDAGRTIAFTADTTRLWQQGPRALDQESPFLRFWGQLVRYAAGRAEEISPEAGVTASTDKSYYEPEEAITLEALVRDEQGEGAATADVRADVTGPSGRVDKIEMAVVPGSNGRYSASYTPQKPGVFEIEVTAVIGAQSLKAEKVMVEVGRPNMEFDVLDLNDPLLGRIAANTGGRYAHISTADHLIDRLDRSQHERRVYFERNLAPPLPLWIAFVSVLTLEWIIRRRSKLR